MTCLAPRILAVCTAVAALAGAAVAETDQGAHLTIELNTLDPVENACRMSFLIQNGHAADIGQAVFEAVLFDTEGRVDRMTLFDFGALPAARPRVRQFVVPGLACDGLGQVLINGAETCAGEGLDAAACTDGLELRSRTSVQVLG